MRLSTSQRMADRILRDSTGAGLEDKLREWSSRRFTGEEIALELEQQEIAVGLRVQRAHGHARVRIGRVRAHAEQRARRKAAVLRARDPGRRDERAAALGSGGGKVRERRRG